MHSVVANGPMKEILTSLIVILVPLGGAFMLFVAPMWLWLHYRRGGIGKAERQRLEARVATLERALLDAEPHFGAKI